MISNLNFLEELLMQAKSVSLSHMQLSPFSEQKKVNQAKTTAPYFNFNLPNQLLCEILLPQKRTRKGNKCYKNLLTILDMIPKHQFICIHTHISL